MADGLQDAPRHAGQVVRRVLLRRNIAIDPETAQLVADAVQAALRAGAVDFIPKPFELEALTAAVQRALEPRGRSAAVEELQKENEFVTLDDLERRYILRVLEALNGNKSLAAQTLGLDRKTLYRKLQLYGVAVGAPPNKAREANK